jgi:SAM-dependent methyltransferase
LVLLVLGVIASDEPVTNSEQILRAFHSDRAGITARAFRRGGSYERIAGLVKKSHRVLDLACGNGELLAHIRGAVGVDLSPAEIALAKTRVGGNVGVARAQALPFADRSFETVTCHLAFMLFDELDAVVCELERVLVPGGELIALLGGGPSADGDDAFHRFVELLPPGPSFGDPRAKSEAGWQALMPSWTVDPFERWPLDFSGSFEDVWSFLGSSYEATPEMEQQLRTACTDLGDHIPCTAVAYLARATLPREG